MTRKDQIRRRVEKNKAVTDAIVAGITRADKSGLSKYYDVAICIKTELDKAGLKIVLKPSKDGLRDYGDDARTAKALRAGSFTAAFE